MNSHLSNPSGESRSLSWVTLIAGLWMIIAPFVLGAAVAAMWNSVIVGIIVAILSIVRLSVPDSSWAAVVDGILGLWLIVAPFALGYAVLVSRWDSVIVGIIVAIFGFASSSSTHTPVAHR